MTRRANSAIDADPTLAGLLATGAGVVTIFGKTWDLHVTDALRTEGPENLKMIEESVAFLLAKGKDVIFDAEHFFDGWKSDASYALECLRAAVRGGCQ